MRILVTGASGLLGLNFSLQTTSAHTILAAYNSRALKTDIFDSYHVDLFAKDAVPRLIDQTQPDWILNCAAEANFERCEEQPEKAHYLNAKIPEIFAAEAKKRGLRLLHISTDAVFDGKTGNYSEEDQTNPQSVYARTKLEGELAVANTNPDAAIARVNFYGWSLSGKRSLAEFFINHLLDGKSINGFKDVIFCPLQVNLLSGILLEMFENNLSGVYHALGSECLSKYDFGIRLANKFGLKDHLITPISINDSNLQAKRSPKLNLKINKLKKALGHSLPDIQEGIDLLYDQYKKGYRENIKKC